MGLDQIGKASEYRHAFAREHVAPATVIPGRLCTCDGPVNIGRAAASRLGNDAAIGRVDDRMRSAIQGRAFIAVNHQTRGDLQCGGSCLPVSLACGEGVHLLGTTS